MRQWWLVDARVILCASPYRPLKKNFPGWKTAEKQNSAFGKLSHFGTAHRNCVSEFGNIHGKKGLGFFPDGKKGRFSSWWEIPPRGRGNETAREYPHFLRFHPFDYLSLKRGISQIGFIQGYTMIEWNEMNKGDNQMKRFTNVRNKCRHVKLSHFNR